MTARQLAADHVGIVHTHVKCFAQTWDCYDELYSSGYLALVEASKSFREFRKLHPLCEFKAYASQRVKWRMLDVIRRYKALPQECEPVKAEGDGLGNGEGHLGHCVRWLDNVPALNGDLDGYEHARGLLDRLPDLERSALMLAYGIGRRRPATLLEASKRLRKSPQTVKLLIESGIMRLRWDAVRGKA